MTNAFGVRFHEGLTHRLSVIGVPTHIVQALPDLVCRWVRCSGVEWTIKRLKSLKTDLLHLWNGQDIVTPIRKNRKGQIYGVIGSLFRFGLKDEICFGKAIQAFQIYTSFVFEELSPNQIKKFVTAINAPAPVLDPKFLSDLGRSVKQNFGHVSAVRSQEISLLTYRGSSEKFKPNLLWRNYDLSGHNPISRRQDEDVLANANYFLNPDHNWLYFEYEELYAPVLKGLTRIQEMIQQYRPWYDLHPHSVVEGGEIHFLQEAGGKLRSVASPHLVHQLALKPFGDAVYNLVRSLPWDCTFDQQKPHYVLQTHLSKGGTIYSVDLSSATDYFPLEVQLVVLRALFGNSPDVRLFETISQSEWRTNSEGNLPARMRWNRGQPLGLYPSFGVFTLTHGMLLWFLNGKQYDNTFFVLGDDVVILDDNLFHSYIKALEQMGCPYSREKSITSARLCEFAGKIVTSSKVIPQLKWREISNDNFLDICRQLGCRSRSLLSIRQRRVFDRLKHICAPPLGPGLGFSLPGENLVSMILRTDALYSKSDNVVGSLMGLSSTINHNVYGDKHFLNPSALVDFSTVLKILETFDKKVWSVLLKILPKDLVATFLVFLKDLGGLSGVPEVVSNRELPSIRLLPSRVTSLERAEKLLSL